LYDIDPADLTSWTYLHPLTQDLAENHIASVKWSGDFGRNWECSNFFSLSASNGNSYEVFIAGSEGGEEQAWVTQNRKVHQTVAPIRVPRYSNWTMGRLAKRQDQQVRLELAQAGLLDWGTLYAATSFVAPDGRRILWGWMIEEDLTDDELGKRGWTGCFGVPRELYIQSLDGVLEALRSGIESIGSIDARVSPAGYTVHTLGQRPLAELDSLKGELLFDLAPSPIRPIRECLRTTPLSCRIEAVLHVFDKTQSLSLIVRQSQDGETRTAITFDCASETLTVDRSRSNRRSDVNKSPEISPHTLYRLANSVGATETETASAGGEVEPLKLTIFLDHDVIEVFANDRCTISTRVYTDRAHTAVTLESVGGGWLEKFKVWEMGGAVSSK
jgi:beta-fructofuranosidase